MRDIRAVNKTSLSLAFNSHGSFLNKLKLFPTLRLRTNLCLGGGRPEGSTCPVHSGGGHLRQNKSFAKRVCYENVTMA